MTQAEKLVSVAVSQLGEHEDPPGSNMTKFGAAYGWNGVAWCMIFVWWCFKQSGLADLFYNGNKTASCTTLMKWAANNGLFVVGDYRKGDVFMYDYDNVPGDSEHTGIFTGERTGAGYIAIEGNYADKVARVTREASEIIGAFRPRWTEAPVEVTGFTIAMRELSKGDKGADVEALQILLEGNGFSCGRYGIDGDFGNDTEKALREYQRYHGLMIDGIAGKESYRMLLQGGT